MKHVDGENFKHNGHGMNGIDHLPSKLPFDAKSKDSVIDISVKDKEKMAIGLSMLLADTYTLYLKTQNFHWNVTGPQFLSLHQLFMEQYSDLALAVDLIAERIRSMGATAPGTFSEFMDLRSVSENKQDYNSEEMLMSLCDANRAVISSIRHIFPVAEKMCDYSTMDLLTRRTQIHEKNCWMLSSSSKGSYKL